MFKVDVKIGSVWQHKNGLMYTVIHIANECSKNLSKYPVMVIYRGTDNKVWARGLGDWHGSFTLVNQKKGEFEV